MKDYIIDMPDNDPFKNDEFGRKVVAENFMDVFEKRQEGMVVSIDSDWGTGKTTFIRMWESLINNDTRYNSKYNTIYFNAWENDYMEDPLLSILTEIDMKLDKFKKGEENLAPQIMKEIFSPPMIVAKRLTNIGIKLSTAGAIELDDFKYKDDETQNEILSKLNEIGNGVLNRAKYARKLREDFTKNLNSIQQETDKKVIFFIDELDRCRPTFAIELLETIKHIFNVPGVIFVISLDKKQLSHSIGTVYGQGMDSNGYLRRFFDIDYKLPIADRAKYMSVKNKKTFDGYLKTEYLQQFLDGFVRGYNFSLRDIDKMHSYIEILMPLISEYKEDKSESFKLLVVSYLYAYLIALKIKKPNLFNKIMNYEYEYDPKTYDDELELNNTYNIDFVKESGPSSEIIHAIQEKSIQYFLTLNYLSNLKPKEIYRMNENTFNLETVDKRFNFSMIYLFNSDGHCDIRANMEFMNRLQ